MSIHVGKKYVQDNVTLGPGDLDEAWKNNPVNYTDREWESWREKSKTREDVYYFSVYYNEALVGELFLHDINRRRSEALVGYHIFDPNLRGKGVGTAILRLLQEFVQGKGEPKRLIIITAEDNQSSRRVAEKCGFKYIGPSWEDPKMATYEWVAP